MSIATLESYESQRLAAVLAVIDQQIEVLSRQRVKGSEELISYRKYMWEDAAYFDRAERVQAENVAMTQERAVGDVRTRLKRLGLLSSSPYFGRIDFREDGDSQALEVYVGLHCLWDEDRNLLVYDWRAPICSVFYDWDRPHSIGKIKAYNGPFGMHVRALCYILAENIPFSRGNWRVTSWRHAEEARMRRGITRLARISLRISLVWLVFFGSVQLEAQEAATQALLSQGGPTDRRSSGPQAVGGQAQPAESEIRSRIRS